MHSEVSEQTMANYAVNAMRFAYTPYTGFNVGATVLSAENHVLHTGANIEAGSSACGMCAERVAIAKCLLSGQTPMAIAIASKGGLSCCGICRQFMLDFPEMKVYIVDSDTVKIISRTTPRKMLPMGYIRTKK
jgi:cytidine deaminase